MATRKQIAFDLDTDKLQIYYPTENWRGAYGVIERHLKKYGFEHRQGTVYVSTKPMESSAITSILINLTEKNPWLHKCMRDCVETNVGREHSKNFIFNKNEPYPTRVEVLCAEMHEQEKREKEAAWAARKGHRFEIEKDDELEL